MGVLAAALSGLATVSCAAALAAPRAVDCSFTGARWEQNHQTGTSYAVTVLRGVTCEQAAAVARPLTRMRSTGLRARVPTSRGWVCLSYVPKGSLVSRGACARLGKRMAWEPTARKAVGGGAKPPAKPPHK